MLESQEQGDLEYRLMKIKTELPGVNGGSNSRAYGRRKDSIIKTSVMTNHSNIIEKSKEYKLIGINLDESAFEEPLNTNTFCWRLYNSFESFYNLKTDKKNYMKIDGPDLRPQRIGMPYEKPQIIMGVNPKAKHMYFACDKADDQSEKIINEFIGLLKGNYDG